MSTFSPRRAGERTYLERKLAGKDASNQVGKITYGEMSSQKFRESGWFTEEPVGEER